MQQEKISLTFSFIAVLNFMLRYFNFQSSFKLRRCLARDLLRLQIPVITRGFELRTSCIRCSYLTHQAIRPKTQLEVEVSQHESATPVVTYRIWLLRIRLTYWALWRSRLDNKIVCMSFAVQSLLWSLESVIHVNLEHDIIAI